MPDNQPNSQPDYLADGLDSTRCLGTALIIFGIYALVAAAVILAFMVL